MARNKILSICAVLCALALPSGVSAQEQFHRDLEQIPFIPKGQWITGVSVNYTMSDQDNYQFLIVEDISGNTYSFKVSPMLMYCFKDNLVAGGRLSYARNMTKLNSADIVVDSETSYDTNNLYRVANNFYAAGVFRQYLSMGRSKRFGFFNEVQLQLGGGRSKITNGKGDDLSGTFETNFNMNLGISPGMIMFLNNYSAIEVNVGLLGFSYVHTKSVTDRIYVARRNSQKATFNINLFSITFGVAFYL